MVKAVGTTPIAEPTRAQLALMAMARVVLDLERRLTDLDGGVIGG
jgi:hypothetical protein